MFNDIGEILPNSLKKVDVQEKLKNQQVEKLFGEELERLLTQNILERLKILYFDNGIVTVACLEETIVDKLKSHEEEIIQKVNAVMCNNSLREVRYLS